MQDLDDGDSDETTDSDEGVDAPVEPTTLADRGRYIFSTIERTLKMLLCAMINILSSIAGGLERLLKECLGDRYVASTLRLDVALRSNYD